MNILIDGGPRTSGQKLVSYLKQAGISSIDLIISTHPHEDHIGGLISVLQEFPVKEVITIPDPQSQKQRLFSCCAGSL